LHAEISYFLSHGFVIVAPNFRGSTLPRAPSYTNAGTTNLCDLLSQEQLVPKGLEHIYGPQDVYAAAKFAKSLPYVQDGPVHLRGGSFGSFINSHLLAQQQSGRFADLEIASVHLSGGLNYPTALELPQHIAILLSHGKLDTIVPIRGALRLYEQGKAAGYNKIMPFFTDFGNHHNICPNLQKEHFDSDEYRELYNYANALSSFTLGTKFMTKEFGGAAKNINKSTPRIYGPTMAHLKLVLGPKFSGVVKKDLRHFYEDYFDPIDHGAKAENDFIFTSDLGARIIANTSAFSQLVAMVEHEEEVFQQNPDQIVYYHAAADQSAQLYMLFTEWDNHLNQKHNHDLSTMRAFPPQAQSFKSIRHFLEKMRKTHKRQEEIPFNYCCGFSDSAIAVNPWLTFHQNTASCSAWWYASDEPISTIFSYESEIISFLQTLGINEERAARYLSLFSEINKNQKLMQQIFIPTALADKHSYLCEHWGCEFAVRKTNTDISRIKSIKPYLITKDFTGYEDFLRQNRAAFEYPESRGYSSPTVSCIRKYCPDFMGGIQARCLLHPELTAHMSVKSYFRDEDLAEQLRSKLVTLIIEDLRFLEENSPNQNAADSASFYKLQKALALGHLDDVDLNNFIEINHRLTGDDKKKIHQKVQENKWPIAVESICSFSNYVAGYTYYDLLMEALELKKDKLHSFVYNKISYFIRTMASPTAAQGFIGENLLSDMKHQLNMLAQQSSYDPNRHIILNKKSYYAHKCYATDFNYAVALIKRIAEKAAQNDPPDNYELPREYDWHGRFEVNEEVVLQKQVDVSKIIDARLQKMATLLVSVALERDIAIYQSCVMQNKLSDIAREIMLIDAGYILRIEEIDSLAVSDEQILTMLAEVVRLRRKDK
jgi:hypothetical protein